MEGPSATIALVLAETAAGSAALLWLGGLWGFVRRGFFILASAAALTCALLATLAASSSVAPTGEVSSHGPVVIGLSVFSSVLALSLAAFILRADAAGRLFGWLAAVVGITPLAALATIGEGLGAAVQLASGAAFLGAVVDGLLLGHWYLTDRRLSREHIRRFAAVLLVAVVLEAVALGVFGFGSDAGSEGFSVLLGLAGLRTWIALGMVACTALIAVLIRASLRGESSRAVQGATGFFYLAVITAFTAEIAAKVGFLG